MTGDPRVNTPDCPHPGCPAKAGNAWCYTATGFPRSMHAARLALIAGEAPKTGPADGSLAARRPSHLQADILSWALADPAGRWELSGYRFRGDAQRRSAMAAMSHPARGWFTHVKETDHGTLYEITDAGREAWGRYEIWMSGGKS